MDSLHQLQELNERLSEAIKTLANSRRNPDAVATQQQLRAKDAATNADGQEQEINKAKATILGCAAGIRSLVGRPADFLQHLSSQIEVLACLRWLAEFQILACIPTEEATSVPISDLADLTGVSESQLLRVIRLTATSGFLCEPRPGHVGHTALSARFVTDQSLLDAAVFAGDIVGPAALFMPSATQRFPSRNSNNMNPSMSDTAYNLALSTTRSFHAARLDRPKLARQWSAYLTHAAGVHHDDEIVNVFSRLSWSNLGNASIVEVNAQSTSLGRRLARRFPGLHLVVQITSSHSSSTPDCIWPITGGNRIKGGGGGTASLAAESDGDIDHPSSSCVTVTHRVQGTPQSITDAAVYIYHLPTNAAAVRVELQHYLGVLRASGGVMLILTMRLLPEPGSLVSKEVEAMARARDLSMLQLSNEAEMEMSELLAIIDGVQDGLGRLVTTNQLRSHNSLVVALAVKYQTF